MNNASCSVVWSWCNVPGHVPIKRKGTKIYETFVATGGTDVSHGGADNYVAASLSAGLVSFSAIHPRMYRIY